MNKIINGSRYNTETARFLAEWDNGIYGSFESCSEALYVTKTGNYFLHGVGGPMSRYAVEHGNSTSGSEQITPLAFSDAKVWAEKHLSGDDYEAIFGEVDEPTGEGVEKILVTLPVPLIKALREKKETTGANLSWLVAKSLRDAGFGKETEKK